MQVLGTLHKRKSVQKLQPQMPKRRSSGKSIDNNGQKHRTQYQAIDSPQVQLNNYKRKNLSVLSELNLKKQLQEKRQNSQVTTNRTEHTILRTQESQKKPMKSKGNRISSFSDEKSVTSFKPFQEEFTSRFNEVQSEESLIALINEAKSSNSNPFINSARLKQHQIDNLKTDSGVNKDRMVSLEKLTQVKVINGLHYSQEKLQNNSLSFQGKNLNGEIQTFNQNMDAKFQNNINQEQNEGENFDDYEFGGNQQNQEDQQAQTTTKQENINKKHILPPPKIPSYSNDNTALTNQEKLRSINRYIAKSQEQQRMQLQHYTKQKQSLQFKRQQQQISELIKQYQRNKDAVRRQSQRKIQTNSIIQKVYKDKRVRQSQEPKHSLSLPQLKPIVEPKRQIIIPSQVKNLDQHHQDIKLISNSPKKRKQPNSIIRSSLSYTKFGFGSSQSKMLNQEQIKESQLENLQTIVKKLRDKGVQFNVDSIRKGLLNNSDSPLYKMTSKNTLQKKLHQQNMLQVPQKKLFSNDFYKIFPL